MSAVAKAADKQLVKVNTPSSLQGMTSDQIVAVLSNHDLKFEQILGSRERANKFKQIVVANALTNPRVLEDTKSFIGACLQGAATGLEQGMGRWAIVPFKGRAQFMLMYQGMIELARNSGTIKSIWAEVVREGDEFEEEHGFHPDIRHKVVRPRKGKLLAAYACVHFTNGGGDFEIMDRDEVLAIKARSAGVQSGKKTPWDDPDFEPEMWKKTVLKRLGKRLPLTSETRRHFAADEGIITDDDFDLSGGGVNPDTIERPDYTVEDDEYAEQVPDAEGQDVPADAVPNGSVDAGTPVEADGAACDTDTGTVDASEQAIRARLNEIKVDYKPLFDKAYKSNPVIVQARQKSDGSLKRATEMDVFELKIILDELERLIEDEINTAGV